VPLLQDSDLRFKLLAQEEIEMKKPHSNFQDVVSTLDSLDVCRVVIAPDGTFSVPSEKDGRVAQISPKARYALAKFLRTLSDRLLCPPAHAKKKQRG
jgi:hypothetical protein